ncbi:MAG: mechanosensitive ion channel protein MscS [Phycisphaerae bacterium]|nr:mechanosensitive ion channel protein MscS [Phycisphaerae bacterium]MBM91659.1 mechanosensitive ion channel protein MscS [Phycisphaerae bacterium]MBM92596.1 mechanosensitive ion channel protein MscS [Phycisphaerae bacterium]
MRIPHTLATILATLILLAVPAHAQDTTDEPAAEQASTQTEADPALASPRATMMSFLQAMNDASDAKNTSAYSRAIETLDLAAGLPTESKRAMARELYAVLNRIGLVSPSHLPAQTDAHRFRFYPQPEIVAHATFNARHPGFTIVLTSDEVGNWRFNRDTLDSIHDFYIATENETALAGVQLDKTLIERIRAAVPASLKGSTTIGLEHWQWIGIFLVILAGIILDRIVRTILRTVWHRIERNRANPADKDTLNKAVRPFGLLAAAGVWYLALTIGLLPPTPTIALLVAVKVIWIVGFVWGAFKLTDLVAEWLAKQAGKTETKFDDLLIPLVQRTAKIFITAVGLIYLASAFSIEILPLLTGLGIGGLAVAFAAKDTIENFFGSVAVILDRPFEIGDWIYVNDVEGTVEDLGFRSTRIRTFYNSLVTVPNATLVRAKVDNYGRRKYRRFKTMINVTYDTPPEKIEAFCAGIREIIKLHPYTRKDYYHVWLNNFGPHSLDILVYMFFECPDWSIELREKHRFMLDVIRLADRLGVEFAFPTQTLHVAQLDPTAEHNPADIPDANVERRAVLEGRKLARELTQDQPWKTELPGPVSFAEEFDSEHEARGDSAG